MNCLIYTGAFLKQEYADLLYLLLKSYSDYGYSKDFMKKNNVSFLVICSTNLINNVLKIKRLLWHINILIWPIKIDDSVHPFQQTLESCFYRYRIFEWEHILKYDRILYLDTDILITNKISNILEIDPQNKIYVLSEGDTSDMIHGSELFETNPNVSAFTSGIIHFNNCPEIKHLFESILLHCTETFKSDPIKLRGYDQPFTIYNAMKHKLYDNTKLENIAINNSEKFEGHTISHFPGPFVGNGSKKISVMNRYLIKNAQKLSE